MHAAALNADANSIASQETFDTASGSRLERMVFNHRSAVLAICLLLTLVLELRRRGARHGLATACIGGGQGIAMIIKSEG